MHWCSDVLVQQCDCTAVRVASIGIDLSTVFADLCLSMDLSDTALTSLVTCVSPWTCLTLP